MTEVLVLIAVATAMGLVGLAAFLWALRSGQFDDLDGAAQRILFDDDPPPRVSPDPGPGAPGAVVHPTPSPIDCKQRQT